MYWFMYTELPYTSTLPRPHTHSPYEPPRTLLQRDYNKRLETIPPACRCASRNNNHKYICCIYVARVSGWRSSFSILIKCSSTYHARAHTHTRAQQQRCWLNGRQDARSEGWNVWMLVRFCDIGSNLCAYVFAHAPSGKENLACDKATRAVIINVTHMSTLVAPRLRSARFGVSCNRCRCLCGLFACDAIRA